MKRIVRTLAGVFFCLLSFGGQPVYAQSLGQPTRVDLGSLGGTMTEPLALNDNGEVAGTAATPTSANHAFVWYDSAIHDLGTLGGTTAVAYGMNNARQVVGYSFDSSGSPRAFLWQDGQMTNIGAVVGGTESYAYDINESGQIVGNVRIANVYYVFLYQNGVSSIVGPGWAYSINDAGQIVGLVDDHITNHAALWQNGTVTYLPVLPGYNISRALHINNNGTVVGFSGTSYGYHAVLWKDGQAADLGTLGGLSSFAYGVNDSNQVVGGSAVASNGYHAFLWQNGTIDDLGVEGGSYTEARGINNRQQVAVRIDVDGMTRGELWTFPRTNQQIAQELLLAIQNYPITPGGLSSGQQKRLQDLLYKVQQSLLLQDDQGACNSVTDFVTLVSALGHNGRFPTDELTKWLEDASKISEAVCS
jgi:probable HAF family extracellular repeat protein